MLTRRFYWQSMAASAVALALGAAGRADAAWLVLKNETGKTIVVQETFVVNGQMKRGKPILILPGETSREFVPAPTTKNLELFDSQNLKQVLWSGLLACGDEVQTYAVTTSGTKATVSKAPNQPPAPKK